MRFLLDENFPKAAVEMIVSLGHEVFDFRGTTEQGMDDESVFARAQSLHGCLLTTDRDFFHTIPHLHTHHCGVVVIALRQPNRATILARLQWVLSHVAVDEFRDRVFQLRDQSWISYPPLP
jgi:predicted nuclease of predicted toxin-antitoxin system